MLGMEDKEPESAERVGEAADEDLTSLVFASLESVLATASRRVERLAAPTESSVLSIGDSLARIVCDAQTYAENARATLDDVAGKDDDKE